MLSYANLFIDNVQNAKTMALNTIVTDSKLRSPFQAIVNAETNYAKDIVKVIDEVLSSTKEQIEKFTGKN